VVLSGFLNLYVLYVSDRFLETGRLMGAARFNLLLDNLILSVPIGLILATVSSGFLLSVPVTRLVVVFLISINAISVPIALFGFEAAAALLFWAFVGFVTGFIFLLRSIHPESK